MHAEAKRRGDVAEASKLRRHIGVARLAARSRLRRFQCRGAERCGWSAVDHKLDVRPVVRKLQKVQLIESLVEFLHNVRRILRAAASAVVLLPGVASSNSSQMQDLPNALTALEAALQTLSTSSR